MKMSANVGLDQVIEPSNSSLASTLILFKRRPDYKMVCRYSFVGLIN